MQANHAEIIHAEIEETHMCQCYEANSDEDKQQN